MVTTMESGTDQRTAPFSVNLLAASTLGAIYVLASFAIVLFLVPHLVEWLFGTGQANITVELLLYSLMILTLAGLWYLGQKLAGSQPPKGLRGGIFLVISAILTDFFLIRAIGLNLETLETVGLIVTAALGLGIVYLTLRLLAGDRGRRWMFALEETGFFSTHLYKSMLGQKVRRLTLLGILVMLGSGIYTLVQKSLLPQGDWVLRLPFTDATVTLLPNAEATGAFLLAALAGWFAWRITHMPNFAEFLIATEAEMNKVSWSTRKQLTQDTIVVLTTTFLLTLFLFVVDVFWGWLLSRSFVGVLPGTEVKVKQQPNEAPKW